MTNSRRIRPAADVAVGYAADDRGRGVAYAAVNSGSATAVVRLPLSFTPLAGVDGLDQGYAAVAAVTAHLKSRGLGRVRMRIGDARVVSDLGAAGSPPRALAMSYMKIRCLLRSLGSVRLELAESIEIADLAARARADVGLTAAA